MVYSAMWKGVLRKRVLWKVAPGNRAPEKPVLERRVL